MDIKNYTKAKEIKEKLKILNNTLRELDCWRVTYVIISDLKNGKPFCGSSYVELFTGPIIYKAIEDFSNLFIEKEKLRIYKEIENLEKEFKLL